MSKAQTRFHEIDLLRGVACAAVVAYHYFSRGPQAGWMDHAAYPAIDAFTRYGYLGVHLFFVISGFVILLSAQGATPRQFAASRVARLYPAFWVAASLTAGTAWYLSEPRFAVTPAQYLVNLTMLPHWFKMPFVDGAYWSLAVELHFYIYVWLILRLQKMHWIEGLMAAWLLVSLVDLIRPAWPLELWLTAKWAPLFVAGGSFFLIRTRGLSWARAALLLVSFVMANLFAQRDAGTGAEAAQPWVIAAVLAAVYAVFSLIALQRWRMPASRLTFWAGALTYPVYVIHQYFGVMLYQQLRPLIDNTPLVLALVMACVLLLAWAIHVGVEQPWGPWLRRRLDGKPAALKAA